MNEPLVRTILQRAGLEGDIHLESFGVTGNNHVLLGRARDGAFLIKQYFQHPDDPRDRFETERTFYTFLSDADIRAIPKPIAWYPDERFALLEFVPGEKPRVATLKLVEEAMDFLLAINRRRESPGAQSLPVASEACFSIAEHLATVDRRIERLGKIAPESPRHEEAIGFVRERLAPAWSKVRESGERFPAKNGPLPREQRCISPSDFGFHNTIRHADGGLRFFDFEYAGWDDPAKTVCDFFCQPAVPVPNEWLSTVLERVSREIGGDELAGRVALLLPVYQMKWCCIMLNDFLPSGNQRRVFSNPDLDDDRRRKEQLEKAVASYEKAFP